MFSFGDFSWNTISVYLLGIILLWYEFHYSLRIREIVLLTKFK